MSRKTKKWYRVFYTHHHGRYPNTAHTMYVFAYNKRDAVEQCKLADKSRFHTFNCMALLDEDDKSEDNYREKAIAWAKANGVYKESDFTC